MREQLAIEYWGTQTPVRLAFLFVVTGYTYIFKSSGAMAARGMAYRTGAGENLKNSLVFTWGFVELAMWFWVSTSYSQQVLVALLVLEDL